MAITDTRKKQIYQEAAKEPWFHAIQLGDHRTSGRFPEGTQQNRTLFGVMDLLKDIDVNGLRCLDIGTASGISAFNMASRGGDVVATDIYPQKSKGFSLAQEYHGLDIDYRHGTDFSNILEKLEKHSFDVVVCAGVLYHMLNPFDSVLKCRELLKRDGLLVFESAYLSNLKGAYLDFNPVTESIKEIYTYWMPSKGALLGMLRFAGFNVLGVRVVLSPDRVAFVCSSGDFDQVSHRSEMMKRLHEAGIQDPTFPSQLPPTPVSKSRFTGRAGDAVIDWSTYVPDFFPHPGNDLPPLGKSPWLSTNHNF